MMVRFASNACTPAISARAVEPDAVGSVKSCRNFAPSSRGEDHGDSVAFTDLLVVFTVGGCLVDDTGTVGGGDVVCDQNLPGGFGAPLFSVREVVPERGVAHVLELGAGVACGDGCGGVLDRVVAFVAEVLGVGAEQVGGEQEGATREFTGAGHDGVFNLGSDGERLVGGQGPGVVVQAIASTPSSSAAIFSSAPREVSAVRRNATVTVWSWRSLYTSSSMRSSWLERGSRPSSSRAARGSPDRSGPSRRGA